MAAVEGGVELGHALARRFRIRTDDDAVRAHEIFDRSAFLEEFGVGDDIERDRHATCIELCLDRTAHPLGGSHRNRGFVDDHAVARKPPADVARHREHVLQVGRAVFERWRAHGDEEHIALGHRLAQIGGETQPPLAVIADHDLVEPRLVDGQLPGFQPLDLGRIDIDAPHLVAHLGKTRPSHEADVAGPDHAQIH